ncbi:hemolymph juvenile hormone-binding protein [Oryctes borbonicus]|uniref:Hemolymph juvenile hormone-binding protein n=1 Tax=Oryctes borbonicus TaxID=1629725 RepID=A0A0T6BH53_9SCAR|nr:hemolymph juvenile hormone-binding protein [Oryctes borbonicus]
MLADVPDGLKTVLEQVTPNFEENLKRAFINEGIRIESMSGWKSHSLDDVLDTIDNNIVELRNLKLTRTPDFRVNNFSVDLTMLTVNLGLSPGQLKVEGEYEVANKALQRILPISQVGKIVIILENVSCDGRAGIYIKEDSFVVENYDLMYRPSEVSIRVSYFKEDGVEVDNEIAEADIEKNQIVKAFWVQLTDVLTNLLHRQLGAVIVEYSVNELLLDEGEPNQMSSTF